MMRDTSADTPGMKRPNRSGRRRRRLLNRIDVPELPGTAEPPAGTRAGAGLPFVGSNIT
jgi:hypothetical protein